MDVDIRRRGSNALENWQHEPAYRCMRGQQTGFQANDNWSKMKKKFSIKHSGTKIWKAIFTEN